MFCPSCGFEYTLKTNYCKRCGESLGNDGKPDIPKAPRLMLVSIFLSIAGLGLFGLMALLNMYRSLWVEGARDAHLIMPFVFGVLLIGGIAGLMIWQLSRLISTFGGSGQMIASERPVMREALSPQVAAPTDPIRNVVESPSVVEHTTRQMAGVYREPPARE